MWLGVGEESGISESIFDGSKGSRGLVIPNDVTSAFLCGGKKLVEWLKNCGTVWDETVVEVNESEELEEFTE